MCLCFLVRLPELASEEDYNGNDEEIGGTAETSDQTQEDGPAIEGKKDGQIVELKP